MFKKYTKIALGLFLATGLSSQAQVEFITIWDLSLPGTTIPGNLTFDVATSGTVTYMWETFPVNSLSGTGSFTGSVFAANGLPAGEKIKLKINFINFEAIKIDNGIDCKRLIDITHWGKVNWTSMNSAFSGCSNLSGVGADDAPYLGSLFDMSRMFFRATLFNHTIGGWNTSTVKDMSLMFFSASSFNQDISNWNTGNVSTMSNMFFAASSFNQDIGNWNTGNVSTMSNMFSGASAFNKPLNSWDVSSVTNMALMFRNATTFNMPLSNWNTSSVINMQRMFFGASAFNQPISSWDVSNVDNMVSMFNNATVFNQSVGGWNISNVVNMNSMFAYAYAFNQNIGAWGAKLNTNTSLFNFLDNSGMNGANYDALLIGFNAGTTLGITMGATNVYYCNAVAEHSNLLNLNTKGWTITDGGQANVTTIIGQPMSAAACGGTLQNFVVSAVGSNLVYDWSNSLSMNQSMMTSVSGVYFVTVTGACGSPQVSTAAIVNPVTSITTQPLASATVCSGLSETYTVSATGASLIYAWSNGLSSTNSMTTSVAGTNYVVTVVGTCGTVISNDISLSVINCAQTSFDTKVSVMQYQIYPNPSEGNFYIDGVVGSNDTYTITSIDGKIINKGMLTIGKNEIETTLSKGIYFIKVGGEVKKLLIH